MEHRRRAKRFTEPSADTTVGAPGTDLLRRRGTHSSRFELPASGSVSRRAQYPGRGARRERPADGKKSADPVLRTTERDRQLGPENIKSQRDGGPPQTQDIFDSLNTGVIIVDRNLLVETLNPAAENILSISRTRARNQPLLQLFGDDEALRDILHRVQESGANYANEMRLAPTEAHAEERLVECRVSSLVRDGQHDALLLELSDVTRRARISRENALLIQHGAGRQMIRQLAHEIKNPLGGLRGAAQLLERQLESDELREYTDVIISEADRLVALVNTLLGPGGPPDKRPQNIHEVLEYVIRLVQPEFGDHIRVQRDYDPGLPRIELDRDQMVQAFLNLISNAVTALDGHGLITLRTRAAMNFTIGEVRHPVVASIEIQDDGPGIDPELQDSIFYPLVTSRPDGTGLGLPTAQELISRHGGLIEFDTRPGRTVFQVLIPLADPDQRDG